LGQGIVPISMGYCSIDFCHSMLFLMICINTMW
jgi:hypothetical protein